MASEDLEILSIDDGEEVKKKSNFFRIPKISLFHISVGVVLLFCILSITTFAINAKAYQDTRDIYVLTYHNDTGPVVPTTKSAPTTKNVPTTKSAVTTNSAPATTAALTSGSITASTIIGSSPHIRTSRNTPTDQHSSTIVTNTTSIQSTSAISSRNTETTPKIVTVEPPCTVDPQTVCINVPHSERFDCAPDAPLDEEVCKQRGCCYIKSNNIIKSKISSLVLGVPSCFYPSNYQGYSITNRTTTDDGFTASLIRTIPSYFPNDVQILNLAVSTISDKVVRIKLTDANKPRHEAPIRKFVQNIVPKEHRIYEVELSDDGLLTVSRKLSKINIFSAKLSQVVYSDQFLQLSTKVPSKYIYGLGEHYGPFMKSTNWTRLTFFNKDNFPRPDLNLYGVHPFYLNMEDDANSNGVLLLNCNSMDVIIQPAPALTYRTIGGVLDFFFFLGPSPADVIKEYTELVGRPHIPPYWSLGFHLCRYGVFTVNETRRIWKRNVDAGVPFDVQWNDIDYMDRKNDFTYSHPNFTELPDFVDELHEMGMRYVVMFDPGVSNTEEAGTYPPYDDGVEMDIFLKDYKDEIFVGKVWNPTSTVFPDFTHPRAIEYWTKQFQLFHDRIDFDGAWIDMNEVSNFYCNGSLHFGCPNSTYEDPIYVPGGMEPLRTATICMTAKHKTTHYYNEHNVYGYREALATNKAMVSVTKKRPFVISRSTFPGQGYYSGHWSGDIESTWEDMRYSLINVLAFNLYGIPMVGSDICGFRNNSTEELCARWNALGGFYPFARNHNDIDKVDQDPAGMGPKVLKAAKDSLFLRYEMLPYLYTLFFNSHIHGETVVRPLFFEFPDDRNTYALEEQFMWGSGLMIIPVLYPDVKEIKAYFPKSLWYDFFTGEVKKVTDGEYGTLSAAEYKIDLFIQGGSIIPFQHANTTTTESRKNKFYLIAGLDQKQTAIGELYWDDGESLDPYENKIYNYIKFYIEEDNSFSSRVVIAQYNATMNLDYVKIYGVNGASTVAMNNKKTDDFVFANGTLTINIEHQSLLDPFRITWN